MVRSEYLQMCIPDLLLHENKGPQEWQIVLPLSYFGNCGHIRRVLYTYVHYANSHFRTYLKNHDIYTRLMKMHYESQTITLDKMQIDNRDYYDDIRKLGYIKTIRFYGDDDSLYCATELHHLYNKYIGDAPDIVYLTKRKPFLCFVDELESYFLGIKPGYSFITTKAKEYLQTQKPLFKLESGNMVSKK